MPKFVHIHDDLKLECDDIILCNIYRKMAEYVEPGLPTSFFSCSLKIK